MTHDNPTPTPIGVYEPAGHTDNVSALEHIIRLCKQGQSANIGKAPALNPTYGTAGTSRQHQALQLALTLYQQHRARLTIPARAITALQIVQSVDATTLDFRFNWQVRGDVVWYQRRDDTWAYRWELPKGNYYAPST